jgi:hypothetical protein
LLVTLIPSYKVDNRCHKVGGGFAWGQKEEANMPANY